MTTTKQINSTQELIDWLRAKEREEYAELRAMCKYRSELFAKNEYSKAKKIDETIDNIRARWGVYLDLLEELGVEDDD